MAAAATAAAHKQAPIISSRPPASYRSSSCHEPRPTSSRHRHHHQGGPMLIRGRNVLPVHPKPAIMSIPMMQDQTVPFPVRDSSSYQPLNDSSPRATAGSHLISTSRQILARGTRSPEVLASGEDQGHVSQMYESLAAELKAKLGDPKMGPILLPPKDYDTMSRKQGKLTGIELRRSTNPQLVGPAAAINNRQAIAEHDNFTQTNGKSIPAAAATAAQKVNIVSMDRQTPNTATSSAESPIGGSSSRSSGRSQVDDHCLQRSRSNSSSGLGSISMGAGSPNSSPSSKSSSSEDMRQASRLTIENRRQHAHGYTTNNSHSGNYTKIIIGASSANQSNEMTNTEQRNNTRHLNERSGQSTGRKDLPSPDYCGASDSGHSESGPTTDMEQQHGRPEASRFSKSSDNNAKSKVEEKQQTGVTNTNTNCANDDRKQTTNRPIVSSVHNPSVVSEGVLWNGRVEIPLKVNRNKNNGNTYLATKQIIY